MTPVDDKTGHGEATGGRPGDAPIDCDGAYVWGQHTPLAMVVMVSGEIDAANAARVSQRIGRYVVPGFGLIVDMSEVDFLGAQGLRELFELGEKCGIVGVWWALVASDAVRLVLRATNFENVLPVAGSPEEALHRLANPSWAAARLLRLVTPSP
jgi:anti-anti-sigma factor